MLLMGKNPQGKININPPPHFTPAGKPFKKADYAAEWSRSKALSNTVRLNHLQTLTAPTSPLI